MLVGSHGILDHVVSHVAPEFHTDLRFAVHFLVSHVGSGWVLREHNRRVNTVRDDGQSIRGDSFDLPSPKLSS